MATPRDCAEILGALLRPRLFKALCDPSRLTLLCRLATSPAPLNVSEASECCGVHISGTSRHLKLLSEAGIVAAERSGREVRYRLNGAELVATLREVADALESCMQMTSACGAPRGGDRTDDRCA